MCTGTRLSYAHINKQVNASTRLGNKTNCAVSPLTRPPAALAVDQNGRAAGEERDPAEVAFNTQERDMKGCDRMTDIQLLIDPKQSIGRQHYDCEWPAHLVE